MAGNKWDAAKCLILPLPFVFLLAFLLHVPAALPAIFLPERLYLAFDRTMGAEELMGSRKPGSEVFVALDDMLLPFPSPGSPLEAYRKITGLLPDRVSLHAIASDLARGLPLFRRARVVSSGMIAAAEIQGLDRAARKRGVSLSLEILPTKAALPLASFSWRLAPRVEGLSFELLFEPAARELRSIEVKAQDAAIWSGPGKDLPADLALRFSWPKKNLTGGLLLSALAPSGQRFDLTLDPGADLAKKPKVLLVTEKKTPNSFIEGLYETQRASPAEAADRDLGAYELIVLDGLPLSRIHGAFLRSLLEVNARRSGSILFVADSPDFGKKGDNPEIEDMLPVSLMPRNLKELPDLAILILIDSSGSMFGDKLSLAKVTGLELLRELKATDRVGMLIFSDERRWVYDFALNRDIVAAPVLEPVNAKGGTDLAAALSLGLEGLATVPIKERHVVVLSDGVTKPADFQALAARARAEGVTVSTMGLGEDLNRPLLERLALETGGRFYRVSSANEIPGLLFEDRKNEARPPFVQAPTEILALNGDKVATIGGMALFSASERATVLFADALGDPLFASRENSNRAVLIFTSDLYGNYSRDFFANPDAVGVVRDRLDALFAEKPVEISVLEGLAGLSVILRSDALASPSLSLSAPGRETLDVDFSRSGPALWSAKLSPAHSGRYTAHVSDRGSDVTSFTLPSNAGLRGFEAADEEEALSILPGKFQRMDGGILYLALFFASSLGATILLRTKR